MRRRTGVVTQQVQYGAAAAARSVQYRKPHPGTAWYASDRSVSSSTVLGEEKKRDWRQGRNGRDEQRAALAVIRGSTSAKIIFTV